MIESSTSLLRADRFQEAFESLPHDVALLDADGRIEAVNQRWAASFVDPLIPHLPGTHLLDHLRAVKGHHTAIAEHLHDGTARVLVGRSPRFELQYEVRVEGQSRWYLIAVARMPEGGAIVTHTDTTIHHSVQDVLAEMAFHDSLTGLPNRTLIMDRIRMALIRAQRSEIFPAVMFIDLDGFKAINDTYGHGAGDEVLVQVSERLRATVRNGDTCGRWGGDEFVLLLDLTDPALIEGLVQRTQQAFVEPLHVEGVEITIGLSIGVVVSRYAEGVADVVRRADEAMYAAKRSGAGVSIVDLRPAAARHRTDEIRLN